MKMNKSGLAAFAAILTVFLTLLITGCPSSDSDSPPHPVVAQKTLDRIEVTHGPSKTIYFVGENLNTDGLVITAFYTDNTSAVVTNYTLSAFDNQFTGGSQTIFVTYEGKDTYFTVTVIEQLSDNQIVLSGTIHLKVDGVFPSGWTNHAPELLLLPDGMDSWDQYDIIAWTSIDTANFQWVLNTWDLDVTTSPEFRFWVWVEGIGSFKTPYYKTLDQSKVIIQNIEIDIDILTDVTIEGTVGTNNPYVKTLQLEAYQENNCLWSWFIDLDVGNDWELEIPAIIKGTELIFILVGLDEEKTVVVDSKNISNVLLVFDASSITGGNVPTFVKTAFETDMNLNLSHWIADYDSQLQIGFWNSNYYTHDPVYDFALYINGTKQNVSMKDEWGNIDFYLPTNGLPKGWNYGTFIVVIDGAAFAKDFAFWVN